MYSIGHHIISGFEGTQITPEVKELIQKYHVAGFILFKSNIKSPRQVKKLIFQLQKLSKKPLFFGVDHEGGRVFRLSPPFTQIPPMAVLGQYYRKTKNKKPIANLGRVMATELRAVGFNWNYAPVVDVHSTPTNPIIGDRSFSPNPEIVAKCTEAFISGLHSQEVLSCAKHFPGHGATEEDSHLELPRVRDSRRLLWKRDLVPYKKLISQNFLPTIMTAHVVYPKLDSRNCATLSDKILRGILRARLGFEGVIVSDDLFMKAIARHMALHEAALKFFKASGDIVLLCHQPKMQIKIIKALQKIIQKDQLLAKILKESKKRIDQLEKFIPQKLTSGPIKIIGCAEHQKVVKKLTSRSPASVTLPSFSMGVPPVDPSDRALLWDLMDKDEWPY